jgi:hypothetical protein
LVAPKELTKPDLQAKGTEDVVKSTGVKSSNVRLEPAGIVHLILVQVPEVPDKDPVLGTEASSALVA